MMKREKPWYVTAKSFPLKIRTGTLRARTRIDRQETKSASPGSDQVKRRQEPRARLRTSVANVGMVSGEGEYKAKVVMDEPSLELLKGSSIDYTMELIGSQFKVTGIPGAKSSCGCGTSFDIAA